jgi:hypothetical protein
VRRSCPVGSSRPRCPGTTSADDFRSARGNGRADRAPAGAPATPGYPDPASAGGEDHGVRAGQVAGHLVDAGVFQVADRAGQRGQLGAGIRGGAPRPAGGRRSGR